MTDSLAEDRSLSGSLNVFWVTGTHVATFDCSEPLSVSLHGDDVLGFDT